MSAAYELYNNLKKEFFKRHGNDFTLNTSPLDEYNRYHKEYVFEDGSIWYEITDWVILDSSAEIDRVHMQIPIEVQANKTEYWSSDDSVSRYFYEIFSAKLKTKERDSKYAECFNI